MNATALQIIELVNGLANAYSNHKLTEASIGEYITGLAGIPIENLRNAAEGHKHKSQWFPKINELRAIALRDQGNLTDRLIAEGKRRGWCQTCHCAPCLCNWKRGEPVPRRDAGELVCAARIKRLTSQMVPRLEVGE